MKYYIVDDMIGIVKAIQNIIECKDLGDVIGFNVNPEEAVDEICMLNPDIVLVDLLMSKMDGIELVRRVKALQPNITFVMVSRVSDKEMVEQAYDSGIEFFVHKPINLKEIESVLSNVSEKLKMISMVNNIRDMFESDAGLRNGDGADPQRKEDMLTGIGIFLGFLGMNGEKGTADILDVCQCVIERGGLYNKECLTAVAEMKGETSKNIEQRMRRAMKKGLSNVAAIGLEDYSNDIFQIYANYVYDFKSIKDEMGLLKGSNIMGGRVNISKFIDGLIMYKNSQNI